MRASPKGLFSRAFSIHSRALARLYFRLSMTAPRYDPHFAKSATPRKSRNSKPPRIASGMSTASSNHCIELNPVRARYVQERATSRARACSMSAAAAVCSPNRWRARAPRSPASISRPRMVETARLHALDSGLDIDYRVESAEALLTRTPENSTSSPAWKCSSTFPIPAPTVAVLGKLVRPGGDVFISTINRNLKSFALAIVGAEYLAKLVPRGTHEYERLLKPSEIARFARAARSRRRRHRRAAVRPGARAVLAHHRSFRQLPHASEAPRRARMKRRHPAHQGVLFDLDGTLLDTALDIMRSAERAARRGEPRAAAVRDRCAARFRTAATRWCASAFGTLPPDEHEAMRMRLLDIYRKQLAKHTCLFEGGDEMLDGARTPRPRVGHRHEQARLAHRSAADRSESAYPRARRRERRHARATQAASARRCCMPRRRWASPPAECVYVGDAERDMQAAQAAGMYALIARLRLSRRRRSRRHLVLSTAGSTRRSSCSTGSTNRATARHERSIWLDRRAGRARRRRSSAISSARCAPRGARETLSARARRGTRAKLASESRQRARTAELLRQSEAQVRAAVESASRVALDANSETFLKLAREVFGRDQAAASATLEEREEGHSSSWSNPSRSRSRKQEEQACARARTARIAGQARRPDRKPRERAGSPAARDPQPVHRAAPPRSARPLGRAHAEARRRAVGHVRALRLHRAAARERVERGALRPDLLVRMPESRASSWSTRRRRSTPTSTRSKRRTTKRAASRSRATRSTWSSACASSARRVTGSSSSTARSSRCCSCRATSSCRRRSPSVPTSSIPRSSRASSSRRHRR